MGPSSIVSGERCIYELAHCSDSGRASASMNTVSRERFTPAAAADAVILTCRRAPAPSILWLAAPLTRKECIAYRVYPQTITSESNAHAVFGRWTLNFAHVFNVPLRSLLRSFLFLYLFFARYLGFCIFWDILVLRDPTFPAKKSKNKKAFVKGLAWAH